MTVLQLECESSPHAAKANPSDPLVMFRSSMRKASYTVELMLGNQELRDVYATYLKLLNSGEYEMAKQLILNIPKKFKSCPYARKGLYGAIYCDNVPIERYGIQSYGSGPLALCSMAE